MTRRRRRGRAFKEPPLMPSEVAARQKPAPAADETFDVWSANEAMANDDWWSWELKPVQSKRRLNGHVARRDEGKPLRAKKVNEWVHLEVQVIRRETEKAFQVILRDGPIHWLPKSQISDPEDCKAGDRDCTISVTEWIAREKNLL